MRKITLVLLAAAVVLALGAGMAEASRGLRPSTTGFTAIARRLTYADESGTYRVVCEWRLTIRLHETFAKTRGTLAGLITNVEVRNCTGGNTRILTGILPWHIRYDHFRGALPSAVTGVALVFTNVSFLLEAFFGIARCLYGGSPRGISEGRENRLTRITMESRENMTLLEEVLSSIFCPEGGRFEGTFEHSVTLTLTLI